jgi:catechol 2,3-dioxygenase-like lactoylglutathione lyase family enzyme
MAVIVTNLQRAITFWRDVMGFKETTKMTTPTVRYPDPIQ